MAVTGTRKDLEPFQYSPALHYPGPTAPPDSESRTIGIRVDLSFLRSASHGELGWPRAPTWYYVT